MWSFAPKQAQKLHMQGKQTIILPIVAIYFDVTG
jgi:hypothetical protein